MTAREPTEPANVDAHATQAALDQLFLFMRTYAAHGPMHPATTRSAETTIASLRAAGSPLALQFVGHAVFRDRTAIPLEIESFARCQAVAQALANLGVHEICFDEIPPAQALLDLGRALARGSMGPSEVLENLRIPGLRWRRLAHARVGMDVEEVEPDVFAAAQIALAIADAEPLCRRAGVWPWPIGVSVVRRVERACATSAGSTATAVELAPGSWSPARRAVAACFRASLTLRRIGSSEFIRRATCHALVALAAHGYESRSGRPAAEAAASALKPLLDAPLAGRSGVDPHRLRVSSIVHALLPGRPTEGRAARVPGLVRVIYDIEQRRCPRGVSFDLTFIDLLAHAVGNLRSRPPDEQLWLRALCGAVGIVPPGAHVRLPDGRLAVAMESVEGGDPWQPRVLVAGRIADPGGRVTLWPPTAGIA